MLLQNHRGGARKAIFYTLIAKLNGLDPEATFLIIDAVKAPETESEIFTG
jgi:hypothetical protein